MATSSNLDTTTQTPGWTTLRFTSPDPSQTQLVNEAGQVVYTVETDESGPKVVSVYSDAHENAFATLEWHMANSDKLKFVDSNSYGDEANGQVIHVDNWLKASWKWTKLRLIFKSGEKRYKWKEMNATALLRPLQLYPMDDGDTKEPLAYYTPSAAVANKIFNKSPSTSTLRLSTAHFTSDPASRQLERDVVLSALLTEKLWWFGGAGNWEFLYNSVAWKGSFKAADAHLRAGREKLKGKDSDSGYKRIA